MKVSNYVQILFYNLSTDVGFLKLIRQVATCLIHESCFNTRFIKWIYIKWVRLVLYHCKDI